MKPDEAISVTRLEIASPTRRLSLGARNDGFQYKNLPTGIIQLVETPNYKTYLLSAFVLMLLGWGGLFLLITQTYPYVWSRWGFFALALMALTGLFLPIVYFFHRRFPDDPPADANVIVRQAMWFGIYGATLAWLQLGRLVTVYVILGLAGGLIAIEYFLRLRERSHWTPPVDPDEPTS